MLPADPDCIAAGTVGASCRGGRQNDTAHPRARRQGRRAGGQERRRCHAITQGRRHPRRGRRAGSLWQRQARTGFAENALNCPTITPRGRLPYIFSSYPPPALRGRELGGLAGGARSRASASVACDRGGPSPLASLSPQIRCFFLGFVANLPPLRPAGELGLPASRPGACHEKCNSNGVCRTFLDAWSVVGRRLADGRAGALPAGSLHSTAGGRMDGPLFRGERRLWLGATVGNHPFYRFVAGWHDDTIRSWRDGVEHHQSLTAQAH